ncbi:MAG: hypothetical protein AAGA10_14695 [Bacteroidota bacterium]
MLSSLSLLGQTRFQAPITFGDFSGQATYSQDSIGIDSLLNGPFQADNFSLKALSKGGTPFSQVKGFFNANQPDSAWEIQLGSLFAEGGAKWDESQIKVKVSGVQHIAQINFQGGLAKGEWSHKVNTLKASTVKENLFSGSIRLEEGVPNGSIRLENEHATLLGRFLRNGFAHDLWELNFYNERNRNEEWHFANGWLEKILVKWDQGVDSLQPYQEEITPFKIVNLDDRYLQILTLQNRYDSLVYKDIGGKISDLIADNAAYTRAVEQILQSFDTSVVRVSMPRLGVKVAHFPLSETEQEKVAAIGEILSEIDSRSQDLLENTRLNILKHSDEDILFALSAIQEIKDSYLLPVRNVVTYAKTDLLEFLPRDQIQSTGTAGETNVAEITVSYQDSSTLKKRSFIGPESERLGAATQGLTYLSELTAYGLACIDSIELNLNEKLNNQIYHQELEDLEKNLLAKEDSLTTFIDTLSNQLPESYQPALVALKSTVNTELGNYSSESDLATKLKKGKEIIQCVEDLKELALQVSGLPSRWEDLQKLYTQQVWNPFTATIMKDQVKQRVMDAYGQLLIPSILEKIENESSCDKTQSFHMMLDTLYQRMQELRNQNTSKLERKLKNEDDPDVVLQLFEISL